MHVSKTCLLPCTPVFHHTATTTTSASLSFFFIILYCIALFREEDREGGGGWLGWQCQDDGGMVRVVLTLFLPSLLTHIRQCCLQAISPMLHGRLWRGVPVPAPYILCWTSLTLSFSPSLLTHSCSIAPPPSRTYLPSSCGEEHACLPAMPVPCFAFL